MRGKGKTFFHVKKSFSLPPRPHPFSKKARYGCSSLSRHSLWRRRIVAAESLAKTDGRFVIIDYLPILGTEPISKPDTQKKHRLKFKFQPVFFYFRRQLPPVIQTFLIIWNDIWCEAGGEPFHFPVHRGTLCREPGYPGCCGNSG